MILAGDEELFQGIDHSLDVWHKAKKIPKVIGEVFSDKHELNCK